MRAITRIALAVTLALPVTARAQEAEKIERPTSELITREQIAELKVSSVYQVLEQLHSNWLVSRLPAPADRASTRMDTSGKAQYTADYAASGRSTPGANGGIQVYLDGNRLGGIDELKSIRPADIYNVRRINGVDAQARFGIGHSAGVIYVSTLTTRSKP
jgi:hypothetical protein